MTRKSSDQILINLSYNPDDLNSFLDTLSSTQITEIEQIIDVTDACKDLKNIKIVIARENDLNNSAEFYSITDYIKFIGEVSKLNFSYKKSIRNFQVENFPIFWATGLSGKWYWTQSVWYLKSLIKFYPELFPPNKNYILILPRGAGHIKFIINKIFKNIPNSTIYIHSKNKYRIPRFLHLLKSILKNCFIYFKVKLFFRAKLQRLHFTEDQNKLNIFFTYYPDAWKDKISGDQKTIGKLFNYSKKITPSDYLPFFHSFEDIKKYEWKNEDTSLIKNFISSSQLLKISLTSIKEFVRIYFKRNKHYLINDTWVDSLFIKTELLETLTNIHNFIYMIWLRNYFSNLNKYANLFYCDEMYNDGRFISSAIQQAANSKIKGYGVQHGMFTKGHNVYIISDEEIKSSSKNKNDGLPLPHFFITWGDYFKNNFLSNNTKDENFIVAAGHFTYILANEKIVQKKKSSVKEKGIKILWCTTIKSYALQEYNLFRKTLKKISDYTLTIRFHPGQHLNKESISSIIEKEILPHTIFSSNDDLFDDLKNNDVIFANLQSTTFIDALITQKKIIRFNVPLYPNDLSILKFDGMYDVYTEDDFEKCFRECIANEKKYNRNLSEFLYLKSDVWEKILKHEMP